MTGMNAAMHKPSRPTLFRIHKDRYRTNQLRINRLRTTNRTKTATDIYLMEQAEAKRQRRAARNLAIMAKQKEGVPG